VSCPAEALNGFSIAHRSRLRAEYGSGWCSASNEWLRHTLKEIAPRDHVLESFLIEADQEAPLTPNDLLKGAANLPNTPGLDA